MQTYNTIMKYFWLSAGVIIFIIVTYLGIANGFEKWAVYYIFVATSVGMYFFKSWMMKRFEKHSNFLNSKNPDNKTNHM